MNGIEELEQFTKGKKVILDDMEIPEAFAIEVLGLDGLLSKSRTHKYIRRVPYSDASGKRRYRYYYKVTGGKGLGHSDEMVVGSKFKVAAKDGHERGHLSVKSINGNSVTLRHDETGKTYTMGKKVLAGLLHGHHLDAIKTGYKQAKKTSEAASKYGSKKQKARAKERFVAYESKFSNVLSGKKEEEDGDHDDIVDMPMHRRAKRSILDAEQSLKRAHESVKDGSRSHQRDVDIAVTLTREADKKIGEYIKMLFDKGDDRKGPVAMDLKASRKKLDKEVRQLEQARKEMQSRKRSASKKKAKQTKAQKKLDAIKNRKTQGWNVGGKTYDWYSQIKDAGGIWDNDNREWLMPNQAATDTIKGFMQGAADEKSARKKKILSEKDRRREEGFAVRGNTFEHKDEIKRNGGLWDADSKVWLMPDQESFKEMNNLVNPEKAKMKVLAVEQAEFETEMAQGVSSATLSDIDNHLATIKDADWGKEELRKLGLSDMDSSSLELKDMTEGRASAVNDALRELIRTKGAAGDGAEERQPKQHIGTISRSSGYSYDGPYQKGEVLEHPVHGIVVVESASQKYFRYDGMSFGVGDDQGYIYNAKVRAPTPHETSEFEKKKAAAELIRTQNKRVFSIGSHIMDKGEMPYFGERGEGRGQERKVLEGKTVLDSRTIYGGGSHFVLDPDSETVWFVRNNGADGDTWAHSNIASSGIGWKLKDKELYTELQSLHDAKETR